MFVFVYITLPLILTTRTVSNGVNHNDENSNHENNHDYQRKLPNPVKHQNVIFFLFFDSDRIICHLLLLLLSLFKLIFYLSDIILLARVHVCFNGIYILLKSIESIGERDQSD